MSNYQNLKCSELKDLLAKRGLPSHGKKNELLERLLKHEEKDNINSLSSSYILDNSNINNDDNKNNNFSFQNNASNNSLNLQSSSNLIFEKKTVDSFGKMTMIFFFLRKKRENFDENDSCGVNTDDALESRAKRFSIVTHKMEEENKRKRAERFGLNVVKMNDFEKKKKRAERFGLLQDSEKLKARALRFGITQ
ncbi:hypothetical protein PFHG_03346 [Plasmodium falciparum HB3]|uniref:SAP domain-containing protein n=1 Tax=Plasmodium falciparum (isolate HB3) TaxID=137071 RepID=A0A0L7KF15_PLAFX|nr:hypothetical protein PFHG_03346 [Plasmodium falciparum HB3]